MQGFECSLAVPTWSPPCGPTGDLFVTWTPSSFYVTILFVTSQGPGTNQNESKAPVKQIPPLQASAHLSPTTTSSTLPPRPYPLIISSLHNNISINPPEPAPASPTLHLRPRLELPTRAPLMAIITSIKRLIFTTGMHSTSNAPPWDEPRSG